MRVRKTLAWSLEQRLYTVADVCVPIVQQPNEALLKAVGAATAAQLALLPLSGADIAEVSTHVTSAPVT